MLNFQQRSEGQIGQYLTVLDLKFRNLEQTFILNVAIFTIKEISKTLNHRKGIHHPLLRKQPQKSIKNYTTEIVY